MKWSESLIVEKIARFHFNCKHLMIIPRCKWTGHECDILCVTKSLKIIDFEIKISRSDFFADAKKSKWFQPSDKVWKHYYIMPDEIYTPDLIERMADQDSGILTVYTADDRFFIVERKKAVGKKGATKLTSSQVIDIARLVSQRLWA